MEIIDPIWKGFVTGLMFTLTFGTVFFSLIQTSVKRGLRKSLFIALGVVCSDAFFIVLAILGSSFLVDEINHYDHIIRLIGFTFLGILGVRSIIKKEKSHTEDQPVTERNWVLYTVKGIMLNSVNPMVLLGWVGVATYVETVNRFDFNQVVLFFGVVLATMFGTMFGICYFAGKLRAVLSERNMHRLNVVSGIVFLVFAIVILWPLLGFGAF